MEIVPFSPPLPPLLTILVDGNGHLLHGFLEIGVREQHPEQGQVCE